ncbi:hypothetical protein GC207_12890 [bacterium]|nr:hypothetical protein [bacterium]
MTDNRVAQFSLFTFCILLCAGCGNKASDEIDYGTVKDSVYHNEYFGLNLTLPSEWSVQDQQMRQRVAEKGVKMIAGDDKNFKAALKASEQQTVYLLMAFQHPLGSPVAYNPSIMCLAERVRDMPGIVRGKDYLFHAKQLMESGQMKVQFPKDASIAKLGGVDFDVMQTLMTVGPITVKQKYYAAITKGYALVFIVSFTTGEQESVLDGIVERVSFK